MIERSVKECWWRRTRSKYLKEFESLWYAKAPTGRSINGGPNPEKVPHLFSVGFGPPNRVYAFGNEGDRDKFLSDYPDAVACDDPAP